MVFWITIGYTGELRGTAADRVIRNIAANMWAVSVVEPELTWQSQATCQRVRMHITVKKIKSVNQYDTSSA